MTSPARSVCDSVRMKGVLRRVSRIQVVLVLLFGCATGTLYLKAPQPFSPNGGDNLWYVPTAMSLVHHRTLDLSEFRADLSRQNPADVWINSMDSDPRLTKIGDKRLNRF